MQSHEFASQKVKSTWAGLRHAGLGKKNGETWCQATSRRANVRLEYHDKLPNTGLWLCVTIFISVFVAVRITRSKCPRNWYIWLFLIPSENISENKWFILMIHVHQSVLSYTVGIRRRKVIKVFIVLRFVMMLVLAPRLCPACSCWLCCAMSGKTFLSTSSPNWEALNEWMRKFENSWRKCYCEIWPTWKKQLEVLSIAWARAAQQS